MPPGVSSCTFSDEIIFGPNTGLTSTGYFDGSEETINYSTGALTGSVIFIEEPEETLSVVILNDGESVKFLRLGDGIISTDCDLTAHPQMWSFGEIYDGMFVDNRGVVVASISDSNPGQCSTSANDNNETSYFYRITDVTVLGTLYEDALVEYQIDTDISYAQLNTPDDISIPIPASDEIGGGSVTGAGISALNQGEIASISVEAFDGDVVEISVPGPSVCN